MNNINLTEKLALITEHWRPKVFEPAATRNTGNVVDATFTAPDGVHV